MSDLMSELEAHAVRARWYHYPIEQWIPEQDVESGYWQTTCGCEGGAFLFGVNGHVPENTGPGSRDLDEII